MVRQWNRRIHFQSGFFGSFDAPWSQRSWIDLSSKETQNPFSDVFGFKNPVLDFLREKSTGHGNPEFYSSGEPEIEELLDGSLFRSNSAWSQHTSFSFILPLDECQWDRGVKWRELPSPNQAVLQIPPKTRLPCILQWFWIALLHVRLHYS